MPRRSSSLSFELSQETKQGISALLLFVLATLMFLGMMGMAGLLGRALDGGMAMIFGWDRLFVQILIVAWGVHILRPEKLSFRLPNIVGMILFFFGFNPLVHIFTFPQVRGVMDAALGDAGGKLGQFLAQPAVELLGMPGAIVLLVAFVIVALMLLFQRSLEDVLFFVRYVYEGLAWLYAKISAPIFHWIERRRLAAVEMPSGFTATSLAEEDAASEEEVEEMGDTDADTMDDEEGDMSEEEVDEEAEEDGEEEEEELPAAPPKAKRKYPKIDIPTTLLELREQKPLSGNVKANEEAIRKTLLAFGIPVEMAGHAIGPTVTQYMFKPAEGIKLSRVVGLQNDLALALSAQSLRIEAPIPGKPYVGIEIPNQATATVGMREMLESKDFRERKNNLTFILGKDVSGKTFMADLGKMPHALVAGATGSGKSVCLNVMITSLLYANSPDELKFIMVDPKRVELQMYNGIPHLLTPVITETNDAVNALKWAVREMTRRYNLLPTVHAKNLADYNQRAEEKLPVIVFVIDEMADLMMSAKNDIEGPIVRLCQMARAVGIHLVLATQRPSVDVITGLIKANVPTRIAFAVASSVDSKTILDQIGAERLLGRGDMLYSSSELPQPKRAQGAFISDQEILKVVEFLKDECGPGDYDMSVTERPSAGGVSFGDSEGSGGDEEDSLLPQAREEIIRSGKASTSFLQRRLRVGYARASRLIDLLEQEGFIGPADGAKPREILKKSVQRPLPGVGAPEEVDDEEDEPSKNDAYYDL